MTTYRKFTKDVATLFLFYKKRKPVLKEKLMKGLREPVLRTDKGGIRWNMGSIIVTISLLMPLALLQLGFTMTRFSRR